MRTDRRTDGQTDGRTDTRAYRVPLQLHWTGLKIKTTTKKDFVTTNIVDNYVRNNDRCYNVQTCNTTELSESFFIKTVREWNALDNNTVNAPTVVAFGNLIRQGLAMDN